MGRIRHLDVTDLWMQEQFNNKKATLDKVLGADNPADVLAKYVTDRLWRNLVCHWSRVKSWPPGHALLPGS